jgi:Antibiotic biosynthesis monooxygenase
MSGRTQRFAGKGLDAILGDKGPRASRQSESGSRNIFTIIRKFSLTRGAAGEVARLVQESFVPLLREQPGFREYFLLDGGPDVLISIRVFDSADEALASNEIAANWIRNHILKFTKGMPDVMAGAVLVADGQATAPP